MQMTGDRHCEGAFTRNRRRTSRRPKMVLGGKGAGRKAEMNGNPMQMRSGRRSGKNMDGRSPKVIVGGHRAGRHRDMRKSGTTSKRPKVMIGGHGASIWKKAEDGTAFGESELHREGVLCGDETCVRRTQ